MARQSRRSRAPIHDDFDGAWKNMLTERRFADFVAFFLPDIHALIDWTRGVVFLEQELRAITRKTKRGQKALDRLVQVWLKEGGQHWVLVHAEIQSQTDPDLPKRMFQYYFRAFDLFDGRPLTCLAILGDGDPDWKPQTFGTDWWGTKLGFAFRAVKLLEYETRQAELETAHNPFARFVLAHLKTVATQGDYESRLAWKVRIIQGLYELGVSEAEIGQLCHDFDWLLALPEPLAVRYHNTMIEFEEEREMPHMSTAERIGHRAGRKEGLAEGEKIGQEKGQIQEAVASITEIIVARFGAISEETAFRLLQITDLERLRQLRRLLVNGATLAVFDQELSF